MKKQIWILLVFAVLFSACNEEDFLDPLTPEEEIFQEEAPSTNDENTEEGALTLYKISGNEISKIKDYSVPNNLLIHQQDYDKHLKMWAFVTRLIPFEERDKMVEFEVFYGNNDLAGYVTPINENDLSKWKFALAIDAAEDLEQINFKDFFTYLTLHEYGHILTLNNEQVQANQDACGAFHTGEGCSKDNSYINRLYELGWKDIYNELEEGGENANLYEKYPDRFVTDYAASNPGEDIAEVFSFFVTQSDRPTGTKIADQKIQLLYEFPELVTLRNRIRQNADVQTLRAGSWKENPLSKRFKLKCSNLKHNHF